MSFRYIGSKARLANAILEHVGKPDGGVFVDAFSGTGAVAEAASLLGWPVHVNDHLISSAITSFVRVVSSESAIFSKFGGYDHAIAALNSSESDRGFIWREYSPASTTHCSIARMYFTEENAQRIDGMRNTISCWKQQKKINDIEEKVLIADLILATNRVANTAGTYGCFLSKWQRTSLDQLVISPRQLRETAPHVSMTTKDVLEIACHPRDTVYLDPPYTKRQYAAYYHILETVALADEPTVIGVCGIRPWRSKASVYCYKIQAANALSTLIQKIRAKRVFLSYSAEGQVPLETLTKMFTNLGKVTLHELDRISRYRPNRVASEGNGEVSELLFSIEKNF